MTRRGVYSLVGVYFSGTRNTKHCVSEFVWRIDESSASIAIEAPDVKDIITEHDAIVF